jgi:hypothetical protein
VPAAAVIPAPIAYIKIVEVKKLVVETWVWLAGPPHRVYLSGRAFLLENLMPFTGRVGDQNFYFEKIRVFKAGLCSNTLAWNNRIRRRSYFVGFQDRRND